MAKRKHKRRGLGYGCPCAVATKKSGCVSVATPGSRRVRTICKTPFGYREVTKIANRKSRAKYTRKPSRSTMRALAAARKRLHG